MKDKIVPKFRSLKSKITTLVIALALTVGFTGFATAAPDYTCGTYGSGGYNQNCPDTSSSSGSSSSSGTVDTTTPEAPGDSILLNDFSEYFNTVGKTLDLNVGQIIYFNVIVDGSVEQHSITIKEVGENFVIVTFASTPKDVRLFVGETTKQDVTDDDEPDIEATLNSITSGVANMTFRQLTPVTSADTTSKTTSITPGEESSTNYAVIIISVLVGFFVLWLLIMLARRRSNQQPGPN